MLKQFSMNINESECLKIKVLKPKKPQNIELKFSVDSL